MKVLSVFALVAAAVFAQEAMIMDEVKMENGCPCAGKPSKPPRVHRKYSSSSSSLCARGRRCGCPSSSSEDNCCKPVYCPRNAPSSSTSELPTAGPDSSSVIECPCCLSSSDDCGLFLRAAANQGFIDRRCECNPCACDPCAGRRGDECGCN